MFHSAVCMREEGDKRREELRRVYYGAERRGEVNCEKERRREVNYGNRNEGGTCTMGPVSSVLE